MFETVTPSEIVSELDKHIIGQHKAKKAVAVALHNRWRRQRVGDPLRQEITPKNILMIGPTGTGKTEVAHRLVKLADAPFIKIEATKFIEVGYVSRDVDTIVRNLAEMAVRQTREPEMKKIHTRAEDAAGDRILDVLIPPPRDTGFTQPEEKDSTVRQTFREKLRESQLDDEEIELEALAGTPGVDIVGPPGMEDMTGQIHSMFTDLGQGKKSRRKMKVNEAFKLLIDEGAARPVNEDKPKQKAVANVERNGVMLLDEIDRIASRNEYGGGEVSRRGIRYDLLPLVEGTTVNTKYGMTKTDHILFIASSAFHLSKPSDLIPELQGRFPIRVGLDSLSVEDFRAILTQTDASLAKQYQALLEAGGIDLVFAEDGIHHLAEIACSVSEEVENIGTHRLYTVMERLLEDLSFHAHKSSGETVTVDAAYVDEHLSGLSGNEDLSHYVL